MVSVEQGDRYANVWQRCRRRVNPDAERAQVHAAAPPDCSADGFFPMVIVDEAHHAAAATYRTALAHLGFLPLADSSDQGTWKRRRTTTSRR
jgi:hypothetical protein